MTQQQNRRSLPFVAAILVWLGACGDPPDTSVVQAGKTATGIITLGDIDPDEPATRIRRLQPLADFLAEKLAGQDIGRGRVVVARDIEEMSQLMSSGDVDLLFDSSFPVLSVNRKSGSRNILLRRAKNDIEYSTVFIAHKDSGVRDLSDFSGKVVVFQEPHSTSGFLLPVSALLEQQFTLQAVARVDSAVTGDNIGCFFSGDEENTVELVLNGSAAVGAISNQDYRELPEQMHKQLVVTGETDSVPRQLVSVRQGLDAELVEAVRSVLLGISDADREMLAAKDSPLGWTWIFQEITVSAQTTLAGLKEKMDRLPACIPAL